MDVATLSIAVDSRAVKGASSDLDGLSGKASRVTNAVKGLAAAFGAYKLAGAIKDAVLLSARYETLGVVVHTVGRNAGYSFAQMDKFQAALQKTGISMIESRNTLATMAQAHIDLAKATDLARLAQDAAVIGGLNSSEAFQRMIYGIQSGQTDVLRTIGINVNFEQSYKTLADQLGKTTKELTEYEKTQARTNAVLEKAPDLAGAYEAAMGTAGKQLKSMERYSEDLQVALGSIFTPALGVAIETLNKGFADMNRFVKENKKELSGSADAVKMLTTQYAGLATTLKEAFGGQGGNILWAISAGFKLTAFNIALITDGIRAAQMAIYGFVGAAAKVQSMIPAGIREKLGMANDVSVANAMVLAGSNQARLIEQGSAVAEWLRNVNRKPEAPYTEGFRSWMSEDGKPKPPGGGGDSGSSGRALYDWDREANAAAQYAEQWRQDKAEYLNDESIRRWKEQSEQMKRINTDLFGDMTGTLKNWAQEGKDAISDLVTTGKMDFKGLINSWLMDLARMAANEGLKGLSGSMSGSSTSWVSTLGSWFGGAFADGGQPPMGKVSLVGERGPELFVPRQPGTIVPAGGLGGVQSTVNVSINNNGVQSDAKGSTGMAREIEAAVLEVIHKHKRQGGALA